ncbi:MAG: hypothetical protein LUI85_17445 [Bacteroides sp.]|nr:hypothetical protein [Bacteroides sp.]
MKTQGLVDVLMNESTRPDRNYELNDRRKVKKVRTLSPAELEAKACFYVKALSKRVLNVKLVKVYGMLIMEREVKDCFAQKMIACQVLNVFPNFLFLS